LKTYKSFVELNSSEQKDIFTILLNLFSLDEQYEKEYQELFEMFLSVSKVKLDRLVKQDKNIKSYYENIILDELSIEAKENLLSILDEISQTTQSDIYKEKITDIKTTLYGKLTHNKPKSLFEEIGCFITKTLAFSDEDGDYGIKILKKGSTNTIHIFVNGFTNDNENDHNFIVWLKYSKNSLNQNDTFLGYNWASGKDLLSHITGLLDFETIIKKPINVLKYARGFNPAVIFGITTTQIIFEWKQARDNSKQYSKGLADFIKQKYKENSKVKINLYGHSLGANLIYYALKSLEDERNPIINVYLFGGASSCDKKRWILPSKVARNIYNFYSDNDLILRYLYQTIELGDEPIGLNKIDSYLENIYNYNISDIVDGHTKYIENFEDIWDRVG